MVVWILRTSLLNGCTGDQAYLMFVLGNIVAVTFIGKGNQDETTDKLDHIRLYEVHLTVSRSPYWEPLIDK
jgi:hypothetical protein